MSFTIQIKRSQNLAVPTSLANGEPFYASNGDVLFIGSGAAVVPIGGKRTPGTLTANQAIVTNATGYVDQLKTTTLFIGSGSVGAVNAISNAVALGSGSNTELATTYAIKTYVDTKVATVSTAALDAHTANTSNPHSVTANQVGLGNVNNTTDVDKPISTAVANALTYKADIANTLAGYGISVANSADLIGGTNNTKPVTVAGALQLIANNTLPAANLVASRAPTRTDDASGLFDTGSEWYVGSMAGRWFCHSGTANNAIWYPTFKHIGRRSGRDYSVVRTGGTTTATMTSDLIYFYPFAVDMLTTLAGIGAKIVTANGSIKFAIYNNSYDSSTIGLPIGAPVIANNTGYTPTGNNEYAFSPMTTFLYPGMYWAAAVGNGAMACISLATTYEIEYQMGRTNHSSNVPIIAMTASYAFADAFPTLVGTESFTDTTTGAPLIKLRV